MNSCQDKQGEPWNHFKWIFVLLLGKVLLMMASPNEKPVYGIDAPAVILTALLVCLTCLVIGLLLPSFVLHYVWFLRPYRVLMWIVSSLLVLAGALVGSIAFIILYGSHIRKFQERNWLLNSFVWQGTETVLDVGCGRGLLLLASAKRLTTGTAIGIDLWKSGIFARNHPQLTLRNAAVEGVASRVKLLTQDAGAMSFVDRSFDVVLSSWFLHSLSSKQKREQVLTEMVRVTRPGGRIAILDTQSYEEYVAFLRKRGFHVEKRGPRYTFGNATYLILAEKQD